MSFKQIAITNLRFLTSFWVIQNVKWRTMKNKKRWIEGQNNCSINNKDSHVLNFFIFSFILFSHKCGFFSFQWSCVRRPKWRLDLKTCLALTLTWKNETTSPPMLRRAEQQGYSGVNYEPRETIVGWMMMTFLAQHLFGRRWNETIETNNFGTILNSYRAQKLFFLNEEN